MAFLAYILTRPLGSILSDDFKQTYGALYSDLKELRPALLTPLFHNVRLFILILALVLFAQSPVAQAGTYTILGVAGLCWDLALHPYEGRMLTVHMILLDVAKVAGGVGYVLLSQAAPGERLGVVIGAYEMLMLAGAIGAGLVLSLMQTVAEYRKSKHLEHRTVPSAESSVELPQTPGTPKTAEAYSVGDHSTKE